jgi:hypothetical protein
MQLEATFIAGFSIGFAAFMVLDAICLFYTAVRGGIQQTLTATSSR